jgi:hypothetical protein
MKKNLHSKHWKYFSVPTFYLSCALFTLFAVLELLALKHFVSLLFLIPCLTLMAWLLKVLHRHMSEQCLARVRYESVNGNIREKIRILHLQWQRRLPDGKTWSELIQDLRSGLFDS